MKPLLGAAGVLGLALLGLAAWGYTTLSAELPTVEALRAYRPPTVTVVEDTHGNVLGEIFEQRRYVREIDDIPDHVKQAFLSAEDAAFYEHGGVDGLGIVRAMARNALAGRMAQGASTITQQVARNFLLTRDKRIERKLKEMILSWRIEDTYSKDHILFLYLNEIFLGSQAYGVEAASRTYFDKSVADITLAEAALLAGLPQRPSDYSPHRHWDKAKARQAYVLRQMEDNGHITSQQAEDARNEHIVIVPRQNIFLTQAPYFTEHVRRQLVDTYGEERVLNEGLRVRTTCDLELQTHAQQAVTERVREIDQRMGYRRAEVTTLAESDIDATRQAHEDAMRQAQSQRDDAAGRATTPDRSRLVEGDVVDAIVLQVRPQYANVAIGSHDGVIPIEWSRWVYEPNPARSWRHRRATDLTAKVDTDGDRRPDTPILQRGDVIRVKVEAASTQDSRVAAAFRRTPGEAQTLVAARLVQENEVEAALLSMDLQSGAVRAMVGGSDFRRSQFNRAVQARRQVGSTFKPIVYAAALASKRVTAATMVADAPLAFATSEDFIWKPSNYAHEYEGNLTLRRALAKSKNTCTVRVMEATDPGMNDDVVYALARRLGIGGPPTTALPDDWMAQPDNDLLCPWIRESATSTVCMDRFPPKDPELTNTAHRAQLGPDDVYMCRACDMSMALGSPSLTMEEMLRAYSAFSTGGKLIEPYTIEEVRDRDGHVLERHQRSDPTQVMTPEVASITTWLMQSVVRGGTGHEAWSKLQLDGLAGKTGTSNDEKDAWFVGFTPDVITAVWVGYDQPQSLGVSSTGGRTALPMWIDYMKKAAPKSQDRPFPFRGDLQFAAIDESTGRRVTSGGVKYPFLPGTLPEDRGLGEGQVAIEDLSTDL